MDWILVNALRLATGLLLLWFRAEFFLVAGGAVAFLAFDPALIFLRRGKAPTQSPARLILVSYSLLFLNIWLGLEVAFKVSELVWATISGMLIYAFFGSLLSLAAVQFPDKVKSANGPTPLWTKLSWVALLALFALPGLWIIRFVLNTVFAAALNIPFASLVTVAIASVSITVWLIIRSDVLGIRGFGGQFRLSQPMALVVGCLAIGSGFELLRGDWITWFFSLASLATTVSWYESPSKSQTNAKRSQVPA